MNGIALRAGRLLPGACLFVGIFTSSPVDTGLAASPNVIFDSSFTVACTDVTPADFEAAHPGQKVIEARFRVSALLEEGSANDVEELLIVIQSPERRLRVVDFAPKTHLATDVAGEIEVVETIEDTQSLDTSIGGAIKLDYGIVKAQASPAAGAATTKRNVQIEKYNRLPSRELVLSSGTTHSGHGVFFKLKPSAQTSLEGMREFTWRFAVPNGWRGDWVMLQCHAKGYSGVGVFRSLVACGYRRTYVGLHLAGDEEAGFAVDRLAEAQGELIESIASQTNSQPGGLHVAMKPLLSLRSAAATKAHDWNALPALFLFCGKENGQAQSSVADATDADPPSPGDELQQALHGLRELTGDAHFSARPTAASE